jgi:hypothetical protein
MTAGREFPSNCTSFYGGEFLEYQSFHEKALRVAIVVLSYHITKIVCFSIAFIMAGLFEKRRIFLIFFFL